MRLTEQDWVAQWGLNMKTNIACTHWLKIEMKTVGGTAQCKTIIQINEDLSFIKFHIVISTENVLSHGYHHSQYQSSWSGQRLFHQDSKVCWANIVKKSNCLTQCETVNYFHSGRTWKLVAVIRLNTLRQRQNGCHFTDDFFKGMFFNEKVWILIKISLKFVPKGSINKILALVQIMVWHLPGEKQLFEPMLVSLLMHKSITLPRRVNSLTLGRMWH